MQVINNRYIECNHVIDVDEDIAFTPLLFDISEVVGFNHATTMEGVPEPYTDVMFRCGEIYCIDIEYIQFKEIYFKYVKQSKTTFYKEN